MRIALLEDDPSQLVHLAMTLEALLSERGLPVVCCLYQSGQALLDASANRTFDLMVLDWSVPDLDGMALLRLARRPGLPRIPVVMLSSRSRDHDVTSAFEAGADDYVVKPFRPQELAARIRRLLVPASTPDGKVQSWGEWEFDPRDGGLRHAGRPDALPLSHGESKLALALFRHAGRVVSREYLVELCALPEDEAGYRALETRMYRLRRKLSQHQASNTRIHAVYGVGYRLQVGGAGEAAT